jgi:DNA-binding MarR family transcriptional regulator
MTRAEACGATVNDSPQANPSVSITLTPMQIARVVCHALPRNGLLLLLFALIDPHCELLFTTLAEDMSYKDHKISQSFIQGLLVLSSFNGNTYQSLRGITSRLAMKKETVHRHLKTLTMLKVLGRGDIRGTYHLISFDSVSGHGLLPLLFAFIDPERERSLIKLGADLSHQDHLRISLSLIQGLTVLSTFSTASEQGVVAIATRLGRPTSTIFRYLNTLRAIGFLDQNDTTHQYCLVKI